MDQNLQETCYKEAVGICKDSITYEKIQKARDIFADLGDYKDSAEYLKRCDEFLEYRLGAQITFGCYKDKPITWTVLATHGYRVMLMANDCVDEIPFLEIRDEACWNNCYLRKWLNRDFFNEAFSFQEKLKIQITKLDNHFDKRWDVENGPDTKDKIYVFSRKELDEFLPKEEDRALGKWWWLRGHGNSNLSQKAVYTDGSVYDNGINVNSTGVGVRPVLWVKVAI